MLISKPRSFCAKKQFRSWKKEGNY